MEGRVAHAVRAQDSQRVKSLCACADDTPDMVGRRQAIGQCKANVTTTRNICFFISATHNRRLGLTTHGLNSFGFLHKYLLFY